MLSIFFLSLSRSCSKRAFRKRKFSTRPSRVCSANRVSGSLFRLAKTVCLKLGRAEGLASFMLSGVELKIHFHRVLKDETIIINSLHLPRMFI